VNPIPIPNQYGVYLELVYCNFPEMAVVVERPLLKLNRHDPAFILTCKFSYLKYISLSRRVKRFDFGCADVDRICTQLATVDWCALFLDLGIDDFIGLFLSTTVLTRRTGSPGLIKSFVIWTTSGLNHTHA
jgi:hypothetical protein